MISAENLINTKLRNIFLFRYKVSLQKAVAFKNVHDPSIPYNIYLQGVAVYCCYPIVVCANTCSPFDVNIAPENRKLHTSYACLSVYCPKSILIKDLFFLPFPVSRFECVSGLSVYIANHRTRNARVRSGKALP